MRKILATLLGASLLMLSFAACTPTNQEGTTSEGASTGETAAAPETSSTADNSGKPLVGISVPTAPTGWVAAAQWSAQTTADRLELNYRLLSSDSENDQANHLDELIQMGCEIIVLFPHNDTLAAAAQRVMDAGITLVNYDRTLGDVEPDYYVAGDNTEMGVLGAHHIGDTLGGEGKVVIVNIPTYGEIFNMRVNGFKATIEAEYPGIEVVGEYGAENGAPESGLKVMTDILTANPTGIDAIYSTDDELSIGLIQAIVENGRMGEIKAITGGGGAQDYFKVMEEYPDMAISSQTYDPYMMGTAVELAAKVLNGEEVEKTTIIPPKNLTKDNYQQWLDENHITPDAPF